MPDQHNPANFREYAGTLVATIIVVSFIAIGFVQIGVVVFHGSSVSIPGDWMAAMLSLASAALGFLIGKQSTGPVNPQQQVGVTIPAGANVTTATTVKTDAAGN